jgi:hypothetical protein
MSHAIPIGGVHLAALHKNGWYTREVERRWRGEEKTLQLWDPISEAPMATEFAISRFLTPFLAGWKGWALFTDCDVLALRDPAALFRLLDKRYAVMCCQHRHEPAPRLKMDGQLQTLYARKNWTSVIAWNCEHPANAGLTLDLVNSAPGRDLHRLCWLADEEIGALPLEWNWIEGVTDPQISPAFVHYSDGGPWLPNYESCAFAEEWRRERDLWIAGDMAA